MPARFHQPVRRRRLGERRRRPGLQREAVRPLTRARPRNTSIASLNCSSLVVPISPEATEGCSPLAGCVVALGSFAGVVGPPGGLLWDVPGLLPGFAAGVPSLAASGFFKAPRRSASRRRSAWATFSSFKGDTVMSGSRPLPWITRPLGVTKRAVVSLIAPLPLSGIVVSIAASPKLLVPSSTAR